MRQIVLFALVVLALVIGAIFLMDPQMGPFSYRARLFFSFEDAELNAPDGYTGKWKHWGEDDALLRWTEYVDGNEISKWMLYEQASGYEQVTFDGVSHEVIAETVVSIGSSGDIKRKDWGTYILNPVIRQQDISSSGQLKREFFALRDQDGNPGKMLELRLYDGGGQLTKRTIMDLAKGKVVCSYSNDRIIHSIKIDGKLIEDVTVGLSLLNDQDRKRVNNFETFSHIKRP